MINIFNGNKTSREVEGSKLNIIKYHEEEQEEEVNLREALDQQLS